MSKKAKVKGAGKAKVKAAIKKVVAILKVIILSAEKAEEFLQFLSLISSNGKTEQYGHPASGHASTVVAERNVKTGELTVHPDFAHLFGIHKKHEA